MKIKCIIWSTILLAFWSCQAAAQAGAARAGRYYKQYAYTDAIKIYEYIAKKDKATAETLKNLGNCYYFNANYEKAGEWYGALFEKFATEVIEAEYYYRYAQTLKSLNRQKEADDYLQRFLRKTADSKQADDLAVTNSSLAEIQRNSGRYGTITNLSVNTARSDYGSSVHDGKLLFTAEKGASVFVHKEHSWTGKSFTSIYFADIREDGTLGKAKLYSKSIRSILNEADAVFSKDGKTMYFTRNNYRNRRGYSTQEITLLKIYRATLKNGKWKNVEELPFNGNEFNTAHPVVSPDGKTMYFVSDRPGGYGSSDLWKINIENGNFGTPVNMGDRINTGGRETFPFITENNELYFASDARAGLGGLDIYAVKLKSDGSIGKVYNVGEPVNSPWDDFAYIIDTETRKGFFSSNRPGGKGSDDIYGFTEKQPVQLECMWQLMVRVTDAETGNRIEGADIVLLTETGEESRYMDGPSEVPCSTYRLRVKAERYTGVELELTFPEEGEGVVEKDIVLNKVDAKSKKPEMKKGDDLFKVLDLNVIFFDSDRDNIRPDAAKELAKVVTAMKDNPAMKIDVRAHTDSRGSDSYNLKLSERRAKSTAMWIISQGIERSRVTYKGYGETQLLNECRNGINCAADKHAENRRSEFIVVDI